MRSYNMVAITALILVMFLTAQEVCSFTVNRPRKPLKRTPASTSPTTAPTFQPSPEAPAVNNFGPGGQPGGAGPGPGGGTTAPTAKPTPSPTPSVYVPTRSKFPVFVLGMTLFLLFGVMVWYYTRNVNFKRLFK